MDAIDPVRGCSQQAYLDYLRALSLPALQSQLDEAEARYVRNAGTELGKHCSVVLQDVQLVAAERGIIVRPDVVPT